MPGIVLIITFTSCLLAHACSIVLHGSYGQPVGKFLLKVKVFDRTESKLPYKQALLRDSVPIVLGLIAYALSAPRILDGSYPFDDIDQNHFKEIDMLPMMFSAFVSSAWFPLEVVTMLTNKKRRAVHDFIAHSIVKRISQPRFERDTAWMHSSSVPAFALRLIYFDTRSALIYNLPISKPIPDNIEQT